MTDLTPEQEALVEAVARTLNPSAWGVLDLFGGDRNRLDDYQIAALDTSLRNARAIIPLIYTAGRRAGIEEALEPLRNLVNFIGDKDMRVYATDLVVKEAREAIRNLSEESGRG